LFAALSAGSGIHLAGTSVAVASATSTIPFCFSGASAIRATLGFIGELLGSVKFLFFHREGEGFAAICAL
jgi:hypothetical protein